MKTLAELKNEYRPYDTLPAFDEGFAAYALGNYNNPHDAGLSGCKL